MTTAVWRTVPTTGDSAVDQEIRDLNDALTQANQELTRLRRDNDAALAKLLEWQTSPLVPRQDYDRAIARAEQAEAATDALAGEIARLREAPGDEVLLAQRDAAMGLLAKLLRQIESVGGYSTPEQQKQLREARALIAEGGR